MTAYLCPPGRRFLIILTGQSGGLLLLGLGEDGVGLVNDLPMKPVAEGRHIVIQPHKLRLCDSECRPFDRRITLNDCGFPVRIFAGVLIRCIRQHQIFNDGLVLLINFPDSRRGCRFLL